MHQNYPAWGPIADLRNSKGWSRARLAAKIQTPYGAICALDEGGAVSDGTFRLVAKVLEVDEKHLRKLHRDISKGPIGRTRALRSTSYRPGWNDL